MSNIDTLPPPLSDERPWAQGFNDWLAFGDAASGLNDPEYERGKVDAKKWFYRHRT
jgi:hypothetical protein